MNKQIDVHMSDSPHAGAEEGWNGYYGGAV